MSRDCRIAVLPDRVALRVAGEDASSFLQGLVTADVKRLADGAAALSGLLSPQGKILFEFFLVRQGDAFLLETARAGLADLVKRLGLCRLRAKVAIAPLENHTVLAAWPTRPDAVPEGACVYSDPRLPALGFRLIVPGEAALSDLGCAVSSDAEYHAHRIGLSIPEGGRDWTFGDAFPHEAAYDQLGALDFAKGCYVGQEVVSRMEHRGTARSRVVSVLAADDLPPPGTPIVAGALPIGTMGSSARSRGIAIARLDRTARSMASGEAIVCAGVPVTLAIPAWARYRFPEAQEVTP